MPLFPELEPLLREAFEQAPVGAEYVLEDSVRLHTNLATTFAKIVKRAGHVPWPRLWHNLRGSRQTEPADEFPLHVGCDWLGNDPKTALKHYLRTITHHLMRATAPAAREKTSAQIAAAARRTDPQDVDAGRARSRKTGVLAAANEVVRVGAEAIAPASWPPRDSNPMHLSKSALFPGVPKRFGTGFSTAKSRAAFFATTA